MNKKAQLNFNFFSNFVLIIIFLVLVSVSGIIAGIIYYDMSLIKSTLETVNFPLPIENNVTAAKLNMTHFQDILRVVVYPLLGLKEALPYLTYFMLFGFIIALAISAYLSGKNPIYFILHFLFTLLMTYFCFLISNSYITLLGNPFINNLMVNFIIYNRIMIFLPQIVFFVSLLFGAIAFINLMKPQNNTSYGPFDYGGGY